MSDPKFSPGDRVWKTGIYSGPGEIVAMFELDTDVWRYVVAHKIEGGSGVFLHIYSAGQLIPECDQCGGSGFDTPGTGYGNVCGKCGGQRYA